MTDEMRRIEDRLWFYEELFFQEIYQSHDAKRAGRLHEGICLIDSALETLAIGTVDAVLYAVKTLPLLERIMEERGE